MFLTLNRCILFTILSCKLQLVIQNYQEPSDPLYNHELAKLIKDAKGLKADEALQL